jgi:hypothetical protein
MPLGNFREAEMGTHIIVKSTYSEGAEQYYEVRLKDPTSRQILLLTGLDEDAKDKVLSILKTI